MLNLFFVLFQVMQSGQTELPQQIFNVVWMNSHEEETEAIKVYRPVEYKFPASRGREGFLIRKNGDFVMNAIGAADGNIKLTGSWRADGDLIYVSFKKAADRNFKFRILSFDKTLLKIVKIES